MEIVVLDVLPNLFLDNHASVSRTAGLRDELTKFLRNVIPLHQALLRDCGRRYECAAFKAVLVTKNFAILILHHTNTVDRILLSVRAVLLSHVFVRQRIQETVGEEYLAVGLVSRKEVGKQALRFATGALQLRAIKYIVDPVIESFDGSIGSFFGVKTVVLQSKANFLGSRIILRQLGVATRVVLDFAFQVKATILANTTELSKRVLVGARVLDVFTDRGSVVSFFRALGSIKALAILPVEVGEDLGELFLTKLAAAEELVTFDVLSTADADHRQRHAVLVALTKVAVITFGLEHAEFARGQHVVRVLGALKHVLLSLVLSQGQCRVEVGVNRRHFICELVVVNRL